MDYDSIAVLHTSDPAIAALRKDWLPLAVSFLYHVFKEKHEVQIRQELFLERLDIYLENINTMLVDTTRYRHEAIYYMDRWSREDDLLRVRSRDEGFIVQLSPHAERLLGWFEELQNRGMVGTESRLRNILALLDEVVTLSTEDVEARLQQLYDKRDQIEQEIARIETTRQIDGLTDIQIRERLDNIQGIARQLLRDFGRVEERFREMAYTIQQAQLNPKLRRGDILNTALDADEQLSESDEGQSFNAFYELLTHPQQRETFDTLIRTVFTTPRLAPLAGDSTVLRRLTSYLLDAGERVNQSNQRLAEHLRRVVDTRNVTESRRVQALAREIKHLTSRLGDQIYALVDRRVFLTIEAEPDVELPLERPLFDPPQETSSVQYPHMASALIDDDALVAVYATFYIDESLLEDNIRRLLMSREEVTFNEVITSYPIQQGMAELISYVHIATRNFTHTINPTTQELVTIQTRNGDTRTIAVPHIVFRRVIKEESLV